MCILPYMEMKFFPGNVSRFISFQRFIASCVSIHKRLMKRKQGGLSLRSIFILHESNKVYAKCSLDTHINNM